ncbi:MAG TPA: AraC family transcriptional regulator [Gemmatimonadaceae bacterium]|nr:AraC family transcriptional regulator [Gemmatimonadaceae bacterium]
MADNCLRAKTRERVGFRAWPVEGVEAMTASTSHAYPRHTHDVYGIGMMVQGGHSSWSDRGRVEAIAGDLIALNPGEVTDGRSINDGPRAWRMLYMSPVLVHRIVADMFDGRDHRFMLPPVFSDEVARREVTGVFGAAFDAFAARDEMEAETTLIRLIRRWLSHSTIGTRPGGGDAAIHRARERIDADPAARVSLADLAREAGISRYRLIRAFRRELGLTPHAYIVQQRIALARRLLHAGTDLATTAVSAGFADQAHLTRCWTRQFGAPPGHYVRSRRRVGVVRW